MQHNKLKTDLQKDSTTGDYTYPNNSQTKLHFLDNYSESAIMIQPTSDGESFSQKGVNRDQCGVKKTFNKNYWKTKNFKCGKEGHPAYHCP